jgi:tetratricopeptide (TPR) repeat protein
MKLGNAYLQDKQYVESEKVFQKAAQLDPGNPLPTYTLGLQYMNTDRLPEAEKRLLDAQRLAPADGNVYYALGSLYNKQSKFEDAVNYLNAALSLKPNLPAARYELGVAYSNLGNQEDATSQLKTLVTDKSPYASDLYFVLNKPRIVGMGVAPDSQFNLALGAQTQLWSFDASFLTPDTSKVVSVNIQFDKGMDLASVTNPGNWTIGKAKGGVAGYYNNMVPTSANDVKIPSTPLSVTYNAYTGQATVSFMLNQNATGDATIDPGHLVFKFTGKDANGRSMDTSADQIDSKAGTSF